MPRARLPQLHSITDGSFEPNRKNPILLGDDDVLDTHQKVIKIGGENTPLSLNKDELRINGDLFLNGKLTSHLIECDSDYLTFRPNIYTRFESTDYSGTLDLYVASGVPYWMPSGSTTYFANNGRGYFNFGTISQITMFQMNLTGATFTIQENDDTENYLQLSVFEHGATTIKTHDEDATVAHLTLEADGDLILDPASQKTIINATDGLYFDGGTDTYISESSADVLDIKVGGDTMMQLSEKGDDGNEVSFGSSCVGFTQLEPTYDATATNVDFRHSNKQFVTFNGGNIATLALYFPLVSGNFTLLLKQDGTGSRTITNWKAFEFDETTADGSTGVVWAGGSAPTLTTDANHVDILSFYWDADNEIAYGVATLDFQF